MQCLAPFLLGVAVAQILRIFDPDVPGCFGWFSVLGIFWIYIVQFRLYKTVNKLYCDVRIKEPLIVWWLFVPGLNLIVGLRQIHFLSEYWSKNPDLAANNFLAKSIP